MSSPALPLRKARRPVPGKTAQVAGKGKSFLNSGRKFAFQSLAAGCIASHCAFFLRLAIRPSTCNKNRHKGGGSTCASKSTEHAPEARIRMENLLPTRKKTSYPKPFSGLQGCLPKCQLKSGGERE